MSEPIPERGRLGRLTDWLAAHRLPYRNDTVFSLILLTLFIVPSAFSQYTYENFESVKISLLLALVGAALVAWLWFDRQPLRYHKYFSPLLIAFVLWAAISSAVSVDRYNSLLGFFPRFTNSLLFFGLWALFIQLMFQRLTRNTFAAMVKVLVMVGLLTSIFSLLQSVGIGFYDGINMDALPRVPGFLGNPNFTAMFLVSIVPWIVPLWMRSSSFKLKVYYASALFITLWAIAVLSSRGALLGLAVAIVVFAALAIWKKFPRKYLLYSGIVLAVTAVLSVLVLQIARPTTIASTLHLSENNIESRLLVWTVAGRMIAAHPFIGSGPGNFQILFEHIPRLDFPGGWSVLFDDAHNLFIHMAATGGIPLAVLFLSMIIISVLYGLRGLAKVDSELTAASLAGVAAFIVAASFTPVAIPCFLLLGVLMVGLLGDQDLKVIKLPKPVVVVGGILGLGLVFYGAIFLAGQVLFQQSIGSYYLRDYKRSERMGQWAMKLDPLEQIFRVYVIGDKIKLHEDPTAIARMIEDTKNMHPSSGTSYRQAAGLYFTLYKYTGERTYYDRAVESLQTAQKMEPQFLERFAFEANLRFLGGDFDRSLELLQRLIVINPQDFQSWMMMLKIYQYQGNSQMVRFALNKAYKLRPDLKELQVILQQVKKEPDIRKVEIPFQLQDSGKLD